MPIAVISDTHNRIPDRLPDLIKFADEIWHLGDVCDESVLLSLEQLGPPIKIVRGNCDSCFQWPEFLDFEQAGMKIRLIHIPPPLAPPGVHLLLHGHTHVPRNEMVGKTRFLNPGAVSKANKGAPPSFAWLDLKGGGDFSWKIQLL